MAASGARAQGQLWDQGIQLRVEGRDAEALAVFEQLHRETGSARSLAQIALAEQALTRYDDAASHLDRALAQPDDWVIQNRAVLDAARAEIALARERSGSSNAESPLPIVGGVMLGLAGASLIVTAIAWGLGNYHADSWNNADTCFPDGLTRDEGPCADEHDNAERAWGTAFGFGGATAIFAAIGIALVVVGGDGSESSAFSCAPSGELGVACAGRF